MTYNAIRNLVGPIETIPAGTVMTLSVCLGIVALIVLFFSERYRMVNASAEHRLRRLETSEKLLNSNEEFDAQAVVLASKGDLAAARRTVRTSRAAAVVSVLACVLLLLAAITGYTEWSVISLARSHGYADGWDVAPVDLWEDIELSPKEDHLPPDMSGCILLYYKFGCHDCNALGTEIYDTLSALAPTYRVATRSRTGRRMLEDYPVPEVPACVYFKTDGTTLSYVLYKDTSDGTIVDQDSVRSLAMAIAMDIADAMRSEPTKEERK